LAGLRSGRIDDLTAGYTEPTRKPLAEETRNGVFSNIAHVTPLHEFAGFLEGRPQVLFRSDEKAREFRTPSMSRRHNDIMHPRGVVAPRCSTVRIDVPWALRAVPKNSRTRTPVRRG